LNDSTFLVFGNFLKVPNNPLGVRQLTITQIIVDKNGKFKVSPIGLDSIFQDRTAECLAVIPDTSGGAWLVCRVAANTFHSIYIKEGCIGCKQMVSIVPLEFSEEYSIKYDQENFLISSHSGNFLTLIGSYTDDLDAPQSYKTAYLYAFDFKFNKLSGKISLIDTLYYQEFSPEDSYKTNHLWAEYASNDTFLYYVVYSTRGWNPNLKCYSLLYRKNLISSAVELVYSDSVSNLGTSYCPNDLKLFNDRALYFSPSIIPTFEKNTIHRLKNPNLLNITIDTAVFVIKDINCGNRFSNSPYNYIYVRPQYFYDQDCEAKVVFRDLSDYSLAGTKQKIMVETGPGSNAFFTLVNTTDTIHFKESGYYRYKVVLWSDQKVYKELYSNKLEVFIPKKPIGIFEEDQTIRCIPLRANFLDTVNYHVVKKEYYFEDLDQWLDISDTAFAHIFDTPGKFKVVQRMTNSLGCITRADSTWFYVLDRAKPNFIAFDTALCLGEELHFRNATDIRFNYPEKLSEFKWQFGNGDSSPLTDPKYLYGDPGWYTVTLYYNNGYCDSTFVRTNYIQVQDYPNRHFDLNPQEGCKPLTVLLSDSSSHNLLQREYYLSDTDL
jgi:hypothetical protein